MQLQQLSIRCYINDLQSIMQQHVATTHHIPTIPSEHTGIFVTPTAKIGSIGVQVRHRLTTHGLALNITREPLAWFEQVVACGLVGVQQTSISEELGRDVRLESEIAPLVRRFGEVFEREMRPVLEDEVPEVHGMIRELEILGENAGPWLDGPLVSP
jgi:lipoyl(octanoyl) transferase 2